jgi:hypothetical protein
MTKGDGEKCERATQTYIFPHVAVLRRSEAGAEAQGSVAQRAARDLIGLLHSLFLSGGSLNHFTFAKKKIPPTTFYKNHLKRIDAEVRQSDSRQRAPGGLAHPSRPLYDAINSRFLAHLTINYTSPEQWICYLYCI